MEDTLTKIIHIDMDAFFASVEQRDNPDLLGKPVVIGGSPSGRGVVCTASYEAREFGIHSAMPCYKAKKLCPDAIFVSPNHQKYKDVSKVLHKIFHEVTDIIEPISLDEAFLDVTINKFKETSATLLAAYICSRIRAELKLTASAGVSSVKFMAKLASDMKKPNGITTITPDQIVSTISDLPVKKLWGVGPSTEKKLHALGLYKISDLRKKNSRFLFDHLGKQGQFLYELSYGRDDRQVGTSSKSKSMAQEQTYQNDLESFDLKQEKLTHLCEDLSRSLRTQKLKIKTVTVKARFSNWETKSKSKTLREYINEQSTLQDLSQLLLKEIPNISKEPVRLLGISVRNFEGESNSNKDSDQFDLFF